MNAALRSTFGQGGFNPGAPVLTGAVTELKRSSIYVYTDFDPTDVAGTNTSASSTASATSTATSYITAANSSGTVTFTAVVPGLYRFTATMWNEAVAAATVCVMRTTIGGTATKLFSAGFITHFNGVVDAAANSVGGSGTFYANMTAGQTITMNPRLFVTSGGTTANFTTSAMVSAEYCGATAN